MQPLLCQRPACFTDQQWVDYLAAVRFDAAANTSVRKSLERGRINYCDECTPWYANRMTAEGKCRPAAINETAEAAA